MHVFHKDNFASLGVILDWSIMFSLRDSKY